LNPWDNFDTIICNSEPVLPPFGWENYKLYPDSLCDLPFSEQIHEILVCVPLNVKESAKFRSRIHVGPDVIIPEHIQVHISAGLKYMFKPRKDHYELLRSYNDFARCIRWQYHFLIQQLNGIVHNDFYDPDYDLGEHSTAEPPQANALIELGINARRAYISDCIDLAEEILKLKKTNPDLIQANELRRFIHDHNYLVVATDKNLGAAVITRKWFTETTLKLLNDPKGYKPISKLEANEIISQSSKLIKEWIKTPYIQSQVKTFIQKNLNDWEVPNFYAISKIHKNPWKGYPICPCHKVVQNPMATFISKMLKPLLDDREVTPYVLKGTKQLVQELGTIKLSPHSNYYIISGDIVAYYPNVPRNLCLGHVIAMAKKYYD
jgi:hypothetical protein